MKILSLTAPDARKKLSELERALNVALNWKQRLEDVRGDLLQELHDRIPKRGRSREQQDRAEEITATVEQIHEGIPKMGGCLVEIEEGFAGRPGLDATVAEIPRLRRDIRLLRAHVRRWPTETATHPYRFTGSIGYCRFDGRELELGEVVQLTRAAAWNLRDRFESVEEPPPSAQAKAS